MCGLLHPRVCVCLADLSIGNAGPSSPFPYVPAGSSALSSTEQESPSLVRTLEPPSSLPLPLLSQSRMGLGPGYQGVPF